MVYRILADLLVAAHLSFILFVVFGGILSFWRRRAAWFHLPAAAWGVLIEMSGWTCPLTPLEVRFRILGGEAGYAGGFMDHYILPILYPVGLTRGEQIWMGAFVGILNLAIYGVLLWRASPEATRRREGGG